MEALEMLHTRASAVKLRDPGPTPADLDAIFKSALRAPDHGRRRPWRFVVIPTDQRERFGEKMAEVLLEGKPDATSETLRFEREKALRAPLIIVAIARTRPDPKIPEVEQLMSAAAATQNIMLAAHALGYGAMWKTGDPAYDVNMKKALGLEAGDSITGFIYIGTPAEGVISTQRPRPVPSDYVQTWQG
jgi:nitroreductase